ncbi:hypothetical protein M0804_003486 [Polistes exclamans]|nr:hypothetical protein M0804_003486 [Polistes exclamans]
MSLRRIELLLLGGSCILSYVEDSGVLKVGPFAVVQDYIIRLIDGSRRVLWLGRKLKAAHIYTESTCEQRGEPEGCNRGGESAVARITANSCLNVKVIKPQVGPVLFMAQTLSLRTAVSSEQVRIKPEESDVSWKPLDDVTGFSDRDAHASR